MVEVFKTDITEASAASEMVRLLEQHFPGNRINFDLDDCDRILRIQGEAIESERVLDVVKACGYQCTVLDS